MKLTEKMSTVHKAAVKQKVAILKNLKYKICFESFHLFIYYIILNVSVNNVSYERTHC